MMNTCCGHDHGRYEGFSRDYMRPFWALIALTAGFWLLLAMEMLRRSRAEGKAENGVCRKLCGPDRQGRSR